MEEYQQNDSRKSIKGYQIVIVILALILGALSYVYYKQTSALKAEFAVQKDTLQSQLSRLVVDLDGLKTTNDTITQNLGVERGRADSLLTRLQKERNFSAAKIRQYEKELGTMRTVLRGFVVQIDSLNRLNKQVMGENVGLKRDLETVRVERDKAVETADEQAIKLRQGAAVKARNINLLALSSSDKEVTRASRAARLRVDLVLVANDIADLGKRYVYARITGPSGYPMTPASGATFESEGRQVAYSASREVDYQGADLAVSLYYTGSDITEGKYAVEIYMDGRRIGSNEIILK